MLVKLQVSPPEYKPEPESQKQSWKKLFCLHTRININDNHNYFPNI